MSNAAGMLLAVVVDLSGSTQAAWEKGAEGRSAKRSVHTEGDSSISRAGAALDAAQAIVSVAQEVAEREGRDAQVALLAVGTQSPAGTSDLCCMIQHVDVLRLASRFTTDDLVYFTKNIASGGEKAEVWIRRRVARGGWTDHHSTLLGRYLKRNTDKVNDLMALIPEADSGAATCARADAYLRGGDNFLCTIAKWTLLPAGDMAAEHFAVSAPDSDTHPAWVKAKEFVDSQEEFERTVVVPDPWYSVAPGHPRPRPVAEVAGLLKSSIAALSDLKPYVFGGTPLTEAFETTREMFAANSSKHKIVVIISDGQANEPKTALQVATDFHRDGITVVGCYITDQMLPGVKQLFHRAERTWDKGATDLFHMCSGGFQNTGAPVSLLVRSGWTVPDEGECRLFFRANTLSAMKNFLTLVQAGLLQTDRNNLLIGLGEIDWTVYKLPTVIASSKVEDQAGQPTCWAHAVGTVLHLAMKRVVGRDGGYPSFEKIKNHLFKKLSDEANGFHAAEHSNSIEAALNAVKDEYRVRYQQVSESEARQALFRHRLVVARFDLFGHDGEDKNDVEEWDLFSRFFKADPAGTLKRSDVERSLGCEGRKLQGHAVVLVGAGPEYLEFQNSWNENFGNAGRFKIQNAGVLRNLAFYDVFWTEPMLRDCEKTAWAAECTRLYDQLCSDYPTLAKLYKKEDVV